jgi:hypothetical protein
MTHIPRAVVHKSGRAVHKLVSPSSLVTPRRWDLAVKWRFFRHLIDGTDPDAGRVYCWHIETRAHANARVRIGMDGKSGIEQYVQDCGRLLASMRASGFIAAHAVPIDPDGELLGGAHRTACAIALGLPAIPVTDEMRRVWAPAWDKQWFVSNGVEPADMERIAADWVLIAPVKTASA